MHSQALQRVHRKSVRHGKCRIAMALAATMSVAITALFASMPALAQTSTVSSNWSGYAVTGPTKAFRFKRVAGSWVQQAAKCKRGEATYSVAWVGLGGFNRGSSELEQAGTAMDCSRSGHALYSAWYELIPAAPATMRLAVHPGDAIAASVAEQAGRTIMQVRDLTTHRVRTAVKAVSSPDLSSAEWIVEAPSLCFSTSRCTPLPLADFGTIAFTHASVSTATARRAPIDAWPLRVTRLELRDYADGRQGPQAQAAATAATGIASALSAAGNAFTVTWRALSNEGSQAPQPPPKLTTAEASARR